MKSSEHLNKYSQFLLTKLGIKGSGEQLIIFGSNYMLVKDNVHLILSKLTILDF